MSLKDYLRLIGTIISLLGFTCLPLVLGTSPKRDLSLFNNFSDLGFFLKGGLFLLVTGLVVLILSFFIPNKK